MSKPWDPPLLFVEQHPHDRHKNKHALNSAQVKSHVAKSYRFPRIEGSHPPSQSTLAITSLQPSSCGLDPAVVRDQGSRALSWRLYMPSRARRRKTKGKPMTKLRYLAAESMAGTLPPAPPPLLPEIFSSRQSERSMVFEYYVKEWWPHGGHLGISSAVFGFTPILSPDHQLVNHRVSAALQYPSTLSIQAILASSACRMQIVRNRPFVDPHLCEVLYLEALASLRTRLSSGAPVDEQLVLDISGLIYAEIFNKSGPPADVLWNICKETIIKLGGLGKLPPTTALAALSTDFFVANAKLTTPALDPYRCLALLGLRVSGMSDTETTAQVQAAALVAKLDPRCQAIIDLTRYLGSQWSDLWKLPGINRSLMSLRTHRTRFAKNFRSPLSTISASSDTTTPVPLRVLEADCQALRMKMWAFNTWLAYSSVTDDGSPAPSIALAPGWAEDAISFIWVDIDTITLLLKGTEWELRQDHILWISAMGIFASKIEVDRLAYVRVLGQVANQIGIQTAARLIEELSLHLPLEQIPGYDAQVLCSIFEGINTGGPGS